MAGYQNLLVEFLQLTEEIYQQAKALFLDMKDNEANKVEALQFLYDQRQQLVTQLDTYMQQPGFTWTDEDKQIIHQLKEVEQKLQPLMNNLHKSFTVQMNRINQTKQGSKKYAKAYQNVTTEGSFIDKRK